MADVRTPMKEVTVVVFNAKNILEVSS